MHPAARGFVAAHVSGAHWPTVVEIGGRDINGNVRDFISSDRYTSLDLHPGPGVDVVTDCREWLAPQLADLVVCCEVLEHSPDPAGVIGAAASFLRPGGYLLVTCAGPGREPHSGHDGGTVRDGEHYANIDPADLADWMHDAGLRVLQVRHRTDVHDLHAQAVKR